MGRCSIRTLDRGPLFTQLLRFTELIRSKGDTTMTVEQLTQEIIPRGRGKLERLAPRISSLAGSHHAILFDECFTGTVPDEIKQELLQRIRRFAEQQS